jgi:hypothetical protein
MSGQIKDPARMSVTLTVGELEAIIEAAVERANAKRKPAKLNFNRREAAEMLGVTESWLASKARAGEVPHRQMGHFRLFSLQDIEIIMAQSAVGNGSNGVKK